MRSVLLLLLLLLMLLLLMLVVVVAIGVRDVIVLFLLITIPTSRGCALVAHPSPDLMVPPHEQVVVSPLVVIIVAVVVVVIIIVVAIADVFLSIGTTSPSHIRRRHAEVESSGRTRRGRGGLLPREVGRWGRDGDGRFCGSSSQR